MTCRCAHPAALHHPSQHGERGRCADCPCPEFRAVETRESLALRGVEA